MSSPTVYRRPPRGRPALGFQLEAPREVELRDGPVLRCREIRQDGRIVGELEVTVFAAALIIDRDGILAEKAQDTCGREVGGHGGGAAVAVRLPGATGFRADAVHSTRLPYVSALAVAPYDLGVDGGVLITVRSASPDWPAAEHMLGSLRLLTRHGVAAARDDREELDEPDARARILPGVAPPR